MRMMRTKKICFTVCVMAMAATVVFADDLEMNFSGEVKTGLLWENIEEPGTETVNRGKLENNDDAGNPGRIRLNGELTKNNIGFRMRWETQNYRNAISPQWAYVYAYGDFIDEQLRLSGGRLGQSPWSTGGYELWRELDNRAGLRVEIKPHVLEGLNVGFVLNECNTESANADVKLEDLLAETIVGVSYTHEYFHLRAAYRFDSKADSNLNNFGESEGMDFVYRVEERILRNYVEGLAIWANGDFEGIMSDTQARVNYINWLYIQYNPGALDAQLRTGVDVAYKKYLVKVKPIITYGITDFLRMGATFIYEKDFGEAAAAKDAAYKTLAVEPLIRVTFNDMYVDLAYRYQQEYTAADRQRRTNWLNLRFVYTF